MRISLFLFAILPPFHKGLGYPNKLFSIISEEAEIGEILQVSGHWICLLCYEMTFVKHKYS